MERNELVNEVENAISILEKLVAYPVLGGESNLIISRYIEDVFQKNNIEYHRVFNEAGDKVSLHCRIGPPSDGGIILSGHTDVVPVEGQPWTKQAFSLIRVENRLYGRGTADMKGFLACCLAMLPYMRQIHLQRPIYFAFSYDEEVGCLAGPALAQSIKDSYSEKPAYAIIGEPTSMQTVNGEKGIGCFSTVVTSTAAHSSEVRDSVSAIEETTYLIQWLTAKMERLIQAGKTDERFHPPHTTIHVGTVQGGTAVNIIADRCEFKWDVRNIPSDSVHEILDDFEKYCQQRIEAKRMINPDFDIQTSAVFPIVPGLNTPDNAAIVVKVNQWNDTKYPTTVSYGSEAGQYVEKGFQAILCGPGNMEQGHRADEFIEIEQIEKCISFIKKLIVSQTKK